MAVIIGTNANDTLDGTPEDDTITGLGGNDRLTGFDGNDILDGGSGADRMAGGFGDDIYVVDNANDRVIELAGQGIDSVEAARSYTLGDNVENLYLLEGGNFNATGNSLDNEIWGNDEGNNTLRGLAGNDVLYGVGDGGDRLIGGNGDDVLISAEGGAAHTMLGGAGNDRMIDDWGTYRSHMEGGAGDDSYTVWGGTVVENEGEGIDTVYTIAFDEYTLGANVENLVLEETWVDLNPEDTIIGRGNGLDNVIIARTDDYHAHLFGRGGNDLLQGTNGIEHYTGGAGRDRFMLGRDNTWNDAHEQTIFDFTHNVDLILLNSDLFANLGPDGELAASAFYSGSGAGAFAQTAAHRIIHDQATGTIYYDSDGAGGQAQVLLVHLQGTSNAPDAGDFLVV